MKQNEILSEIRGIRDEHAKAFDYDMHALFEEHRRETERLRKEGWKIVSVNQKSAASEQ
jgi:hypothetical protein